MEKPTPRSKAAVELDKFKRRLIRAVARLLLHEKKPEEEIWTHLKKETGCDCKLLWMRMRALTVKKLDCLLLAADRMEAVPKAARMSLTDWLLVDLVLVHQKVDLIGQNNLSKDCKEDPVALVDLFQLVKMFNIEGLSGEQLSEAWSSATLHYNNQGHQCSPMLLQRRWYQLKEVTRAKFYDFWYAYRGAPKRLNLAQPYTPTPLQTAIAKWLKTLITTPFYDWEELIKRRLVTLPEEFERKMLERSAHRRPVPKPSDDVPDLVMIEPRIETIDLRLESDDNEKEDNSQEEGNPPPPLVRIKEEPEDIDIDETQIQLPKKSIYEEVLESTYKENEKLDNINDEDLFDDEIETEEIEIEETVENTLRAEEESVLPQITSVFGNVTDTSELGNVTDTSELDNAYNSSAHGNNINTEVIGNFDDGNMDDTCDNDNNIGACGTVGETSVLGNIDNTSACDNVDDNSNRGNDEDTNVCGDDKDTEICDNDNDIEICDNVEDASGKVGDTSPGCGDKISVPDDVNDISDDDDNDVSGKVDATVSGKVDATSIIGNVDETSATGNIKDTSKPNGTSENVSNINYLNAQTSTVFDIAPAVKDVEIIENTSHPVEITDSDEDVDNSEENHEIEDRSVSKNTIDQSMEIDSRPEVGEFPFTEPLRVSNVNEDALMGEDSLEKKPVIDVRPDITSFTFGKLSNDISFADDGIEFVDDGIVYVDEDSHNETKIKTEIEDDDEAKIDDTPQIDAKLLMCPIIYTTRLDDMGLFYTQPFDHINDKQLLDVITSKSKPIKNVAVNDSNKPNENVSVDGSSNPIKNVTVNYTSNPTENVAENYSSISIENVSVNYSSNSIENVSVSYSSKPSENVPVNYRSNRIENVSVNYSSNPIENVPVTDSNVTSDDDDCDVNVITESQKVKPSSYLLQKPRSRRYNPIQLCKNPDFNTRLKRLTVGFFSSPRNRLLIKTCKPLTIDLSKAFESKLISGTLYLKPSDENVVTGIIDDTESCQNVSVVPSAMPAQSLIDNSKIADILPLLRRHLESAKPREDLVSTSERNKVINLPDISEIRRINQRLLTAEVTPIQVQNNQPQVPVTIVASLNTPNFPVPKTITISVTDEDLPTEVNDSRGPPKLVDITEDSPAKTSTDNCLLTERNAYNACRPHRPFNTQIGRPPKMVNGKRLWPAKPVSVAWKPREVRPEIPWLSRTNDPAINNRNIEDTLLTLDALNKMLYLLTDQEEPTVIIPKKPKLKRKHKNSNQQTKQEIDRPKVDDSNCSQDASNAEGNVANQTTNSCKPKINIKAATNYPPKQKAMRYVVTADADKPVPNTISEKFEESDTEQSKKKLKYCCWARQRMLQLLFCRKSIPRHECSNRLCECCCRNLLRDYVMQGQKIKNAEQELKERSNSSDLNNVILVSEEIHGSKSVQPVVEIPVETPVENPGQDPDKGIVQVTEDTPVIDLEASNIESTTNVAENELIDIDAMDIEDNVPVLGGEVSVATTPVLSLPVARGLETPVNVSSGRPIVNVPVLKKLNFISCARPESGSHPYQLSHCISSDNLTGGVVLSAKKNNQITNSPPSLRKILAVKKANVQDRIKTSMPPPSKFNKPLPVPKSFKEKMIFLNSKQISEKPPDHPVFLGKNKILLTTIKFPPNLKLFEEAQKALKNSLNWPKGVHLVYLPNGTISYNVDHNVAVNATDLAGMPAIIEAVQAHMSIHAAQEGAFNKQNDPPKPGVTESEVVDLVDDDDENNDTSPVAEVKTTEDNLTISSDSPNDSHNSEMETVNGTEENNVDSNINNDFIETQIENNQNQSADQNTFTDIQENDQESSLNEMPSALTEQVQDQRDPLSQNVSAEVHGQPEPSSQNESTDVHEISAEARVQSDPSSQNVRVEVHDQPKPSRQPDCTDAHEVSTEQARDQSDPPDQPFSISTEVHNQLEPSSLSDSTDVQETSIEQVHDHPEPATQNVSTKIPEASTSEPSRNKTKNILSDLMEMSGIFDEDMSPAPEEALHVLPAEGTALTQASLETLLPVPVKPVELPALSPVSAGTPPPLLRPIVMPTVFNKGSALPPVIKSPIGELSPITSLYEMKYAYYNKAVFFKLDFDTGYLVPINVCMKEQNKKPALAKTFASFSVIDLTDDDDTAVTKPEQKDTELESSSNKRSLLIVNNLGSTVLTTSVVTGTASAKPVKLFKALKPSILQKLNREKNKHLKNISNNSDVDHKQKRKQFLKNINLNVETDVDDEIKLNIPVRQYVKRIDVKGDLINVDKVTAEANNEPTPTTSHIVPENDFATTISSDDSSDDEPLANLAKRKKENENPPLVSKEIELELPVADAEDVYMSDNDLTEQEETFGIDSDQSNEEEEHCILGV